jgi:hypothetical protein
MRKGVAATLFFTLIALAEQKPDLFPVETYAHFSCFHEDVRIFQEHLKMLVVQARIFENTRSIAGENNQKNHESFARVLFLLILTIMMHRKKKNAGQRESAKSGFEGTYHREFKSVGVSVFGKGKRNNSHSRIQSQKLSSTCVLFVYRPLASVELDVTQ